MLFCYFPILFRFHSSYTFFILYFEEEEVEHAKKEKKNKKKTMNSVISFNYLRSQIESEIWVRVLRVCVYLSNPKSAAYVNQSIRKQSIWTRADINICNIYISFRLFTGSVITIFMLATVAFELCVANNCCKTESHPEKTSQVYVFLYVKVMNWDLYLVVGFSVWPNDCALPLPQSVYCFENNHFMSMKIIVYNTFKCQWLLCVAFPKMQCP